LQAEADFDAALSPVPAAASEPAAASARRGGEVCPKCQADLAKEAVLCTNCGTLIRSGKQLSVSTGGESAPSTRSRGSGQPAARSWKPSEEVGSAAVAVMLKLLKWGLLLAVVGGLSYVVKESISFDPRQQAKDALNKMKPGMTVLEVVDTLALKPHEIHTTIFEERPGQPFPIPVDKRLPYKDDFVKNTDPKLIENGFSFRFRYTERDVLVVEFDPDGNVANAGLFDFMKALGM
jgi:ribosomal protein L40E